MTTQDRLFQIVYNRESGTSEVQDLGHDVDLAMETYRAQEHELSGRDGLRGRSRRLGITREPPPDPLELLRSLRTDRSDAHRQPIAPATVLRDGIPRRLSRGVVSKVGWRIGTLVEKPGPHLHGFR